jgi:hypothetical protein
VSAISPSTPKVMLYVPGVRSASNEKIPGSGISQGVPTAGSPKHTLKISTLPSDPLNNLKMVEL